MRLMAHRPAQPQGVVFDMDGTLIDTERLAHAAFRLAIADLGFAYREEVYALCLGGSYQGTRSTLAAAYGLSLIWICLTNAGIGASLRRKSVLPFASSPGSSNCWNAFRIFIFPWR